MFTYFGNVTKLFTVAVPFYIAISKTLGFQFLYILDKACYFGGIFCYLFVSLFTFDNSSPNGCKGASH